MKYIKDYLIFFFVGLIVIGYLVGKRQEDKENIVNEAIQPYQEQIQELQEENSFLADEVEEYKSKIEELEQNLRDMEDEINAPTYYTNDADKTDMNVNLGPMSFSIIRYYNKLPNKLTFASESADAKCYLVYSD